MFENNLRPYTVLNGADGKRHLIVDTEIVKPHKQSENNFVYESVVSRSLTTVDRKNIPDTRRNDFFGSAEEIDSLAKDLSDNGYFVDKK